MATEAQQKQFDELVEAVKAHKGWDDNAVSKHLGYAGKNGTRDLATVRKGSSRTAPLADAIAKLQAELPAAASNAAHANKPTAAASAPASAAKPAAGDDVATFDALVTALNGCGWTDDALSVHLGYAGKNGKRDLGAVRKGTSKRAPLPEAIAKLQAALAAGTTAADAAASTSAAGTEKRAFHTPPSSDYDDDEGEGAASAAPPPMKPGATKAAAPGVQKPDPAATAADLSPEQLKAVFDAAAKKVTEVKGWTMNRLSVEFGYAGGNGERDVAAVRDGRSTKHTAVEGFAILQRLLVDHVTGVPAASGDAEQQRFDLVVAAVKQQHQWSDNEVSKHLGYAGKNGTRDLGAVRNRVSKTVALPAAITSLQELLSAPTKGKA